MHGSQKIRTLACGLPTTRAARAMRTLDLASTRNACSFPGRRNHIGQGLTEERILECIMPLPRYSQNLGEFGLLMKMV
jgi:hypothetical protein